MQLPEDVAHQLSEMVNIEQRVIAEMLANLGEADQLLLETLVCRMEGNGNLLGNLALVVRNVRIQNEQEIANTEQKLNQLPNTETPNE